MNVLKRWTVPLFVAAALTLQCALAFAVGADVNIRTFGATGNCSTNDAPAIQKAMDNAAGGTLYIPPANPGGCYAVTSAINGVSNVYVRGSGTAGEIRNTNTDALTDAPVFYFNGKSNFTIDNVRIRGSNKNLVLGDGTGSGINVTNSSNFKIVNNSIEYTTANGIYISAVVGGTALTENGTISDNYLDHNGTLAKVADTDGVLRPYSGDLQITANGAVTLRQISVLNNRLLSVNSSGVGIVNVTATVTMYDFTVSGNIIQNKGKHGIYTYADNVNGTGAAYSGVISNNLIRSVGWIGIYLQGAAKDWVISGNRVTDACKDVLLSPSVGYDTLPFAAIGAIANLADGNGIAITGNVLYGTNGHSGIRMVGFNSSTITGNTIKGDGIDAPQFFDNGITLQNATYTSVANNAIFLNSHGGKGIYLDGTASGGGGGGGTNPQWSGNSVTNNTIDKPQLHAIWLRVQKSAVVSGNIINAPAAGNGIYLGDSQDLLVANNIINAVPNAYSYIRSTSSAAGDFQDRFTLRGNKFNGTTTGAGSYGIWLDSVATRDAVVEDNDFLALTGGAITKYQDSGTATSINPAGRNRM